MLFEARGSLSQRKGCGVLGLRNSDPLQAEWSPERSLKGGNMRFRSLVISLGMLGLRVAPAGLAAQEDLHSPRYTVIELGTLGGTYSQAF
jgi:hypothetical protein